LILLFDIGNSRIKRAILEGEVLQSTARFDYVEAGSAPDCLGDIKQRPETIYIASVGSEDIESQIADACHQHWGITPVKLLTTTFCAGVSNGYVSPSVLGVDRWAAMIGAFKLIGGSVLVIDCGTACSADFVDCNGKYLGGAIIPGLEMMQQSLRTGTEHIGSAESEDMVPGFGTSTIGCIQLGVTEALLGFIDRMERKALLESGEERVSVVITW
jgi:type III pantothenate kinase